LGCAIFERNPTLDQKVTMQDAITETDENIQYHLYVIAKIEHSLGRVETEGGVSHEDVENRFEKWLSNNLSN
jgi:hypothetical protein